MVTKQVDRKNRLQNPELGPKKQKFKAQTQIAQPIFFKHKTQQQNAQPNFWKHKTQLQIAQLYF